MLRGPQTAGELRINAERWYRFADISSVEAFLHELEERSPDKGGPLVARLPRSAGAREQRWSHLLCGAAQSPSSASETAEPPSTSGLQARVETLEAEVAELRAALQSLQEQLGLSQPGHPAIARAC
jgi:hypothetical protein